MPKFHETCKNWQQHYSDSWENIKLVFWRIMDSVKSVLHCLLVCVNCVMMMRLLIHKHKERIRHYYSMGSVVYTDDKWQLELEIHLVGYGVVVLPFLNLYTYFYVTEYFEKHQQSQNIVTRSLNLIFGPAVTPCSDILPDGVSKSRPKTRRPYKKHEPMYCLCELVLVFLVRDWYYYQMLNKVYTSNDGSYMIYSDEYFLVFATRAVACLAPVVFLLLTNTPVVEVPLQKFIYCSATHIISGFCFYEGTKYVDFATQVRMIWKSCKLLPVMMTSRLVSGARSSRRDCLTAAFFSLAMMMLLIGSVDYKLTPELSWSGVTLVCLYLMCTSFTTVWQDHLFTQYHVTTEQMMFGMNFWTILIYGASLVHHPNIPDTMEFFKLPEFVMDLTILVMVSALGQMFILRTVSKLGAVGFTVIMSLRFVIAIIIWRMMQHRSLSLCGSMGAVSVVLISFYKIYRRPGNGKLSPESANFDCNLE